MRFPRAIMGLALLAVSVIGLFLFWPDSHFRFRHQSERYYAEFTAACDTLLAQHPLGTNHFFELSMTDAQLPKIIQDLQPSKIKVSSNQVWILSKGGEFGISWEPQSETQTNVWRLLTSIESHTRIVYSAKR
jgi:hypothetical protein